MILAGKKVWEMRTRPTRKRGRIALIRSGSQQIVGTATLVDSLAPLTRRQMLNAVDRHGAPADLIRSGSAASWVYPWVLADVVRLDPPVAYVHPPGAVIWVTLGGSKSARRAKPQASRLTRAAEALLAARFQRTRPPTIKVAGFRTSRGREVAIERARQQLRVWAEVAPPELAGMRIVNVRNPGQPYAAGQPRSSNLRSQAPKLSAAHRAVYLEFADIAALKQFVEWYERV